MATGSAMAILGMSFRGGTAILAVGFHGRDARATLLKNQQRYPSAGALGSGPCPMMRATKNRKRMLSMA
jgi:hypothetical protein